MSNEIYDIAFQSITTMDEDLARKALDDAAAAGVPFMDVMANGFSKGMEELGELFSSGDVFVPELMEAADVMAYVSERIEDDLKKSGVETEEKGKVVLATVAGDVHDIGKGLVCMMLRTSGVEVFDMGRDCSVDDIIAKAEETNADIIATSTLLTSCMVQQQLLEEELVKRGLKEKYITLIGGAPVTQRWRAKIGADYYGNDCYDAVKVVATALEEKRRI